MVDEGSADSAQSGIHSSRAIDLNYCRQRRWCEVCAIGDGITTAGCQGTQGLAALSAQDLNLWLMVDTRCFGSQVKVTLFGLVALSWSIWDEMKSQIAE